VRHRAKHRQLSRTASHRRALLANLATSLFRHERFFHRGGSLEAQHPHDGNAILPHLEAFFEQHVDRRAVTDSPSRSRHPASWRFYLRQLLLAAIDDGASTFDFGIGEEAFRRRFATHVWRVQTWGSHPAAGATNATHSEPVHL